MNDKKTPAEDLHVETEQKQTLVKKVMKVTGILAIGAAIGGAAAYAYQTFHTAR